MKVVTIWGYSSDERKKKGRAAMTLPSHQASVLSFLFNSLRTLSSSVLWAMTSSV